MTDKPMTLCINCVHYEAGVYIRGGLHNVCNRIIPEPYVDPVNGKKIINAFARLYCSSERSIGECGPNARFFLAHNS